MERYCQCCAMPLTTEELLGTNQDDTKNQEYCVYCFKQGKFTDDSTMEEMIEQCIPHALEAGVYPNADTARAKMSEFYPTLKRWKK